MNLRAQKGFTYRAIFRPIVPRHKHSIVFIVLQTRLFTEKFSRTSTIHPEIFRGRRLNTAGRKKAGRWTLKPWPSGDASRRKWKTWVYLRLRLTRPCVYLRWLAMTCAHFGRDQIDTQVDARFYPFGPPTRVNASWVTSINVVNEMEYSLP